MAAIGMVTGDNGYGGEFVPRNVNGQDDPAAAFRRPIYETDATVRRAHALQLTAAGQAGQQWRGAR